MAEQLAFRKPVYLWINNGDIKIFTVPTWQTQDTDLIGTVLLDLRCRWMTVRCSIFWMQFGGVHNFWSPAVSFLSNPGSICRDGHCVILLFDTQPGPWKTKLAGQKLPILACFVTSIPNAAYHAPFPACEAAIHALVQAPCLVHRHVVLICSLTRAKRLARWVCLPSHGHVAGLEQHPDSLITLTMSYNSCRHNTTGSKTSKDDGRTPHLQGQIASLDSTWVRFTIPGLPCFLSCCHAYACFEKAMAMMSPRYPASRKALFRAVSSG